MQKEVGGRRQTSNMQNVQGEARERERESWETNRRHAKWA
jgi:hypothetical protein